MRGPVSDPAATLVLRGAAYGARRKHVAYALGIVLESLIALGWAVLAVRQGGGYWLVWAMLAVLCLPPLIFALRWRRLRRAERRLAGTELWMSPYGFGYVTADHWYGVPWSAVQRIGFAGRPGRPGPFGDRLCVAAAGLRGPVTTLNARWRGTPQLRVSLAGTDRATVTAAALHATDGNLTLRPLGR